MADVLCKEGVAVPKKVSVAGFDDLPSAARHDPPLTTAKVDPEGLGRRAVEVLASCVEGPGGNAARETLPVELVVRGSTAAAIRPPKHGR